MDVTTSIPWRRYFARMFDYVVHAALFLSLWAVIDEPSLIRLMEYSSATVDFLMLVVWIVLEGCYMNIFKTTPGKKLLHIQVVHADGSPIGRYEAFVRARMVWYRGMGMGIGILQLIAGVIGYRRLTRKGYTSWDDDLRLTVRHGRLDTYRVILYTVIVSLCSFWVIFLFVRYALAMN